MFKRPKQLITIADDETVSFAMLHDGKDPEILSRTPLTDFLEADEKTPSIPKKIQQSVNRLLVVPDYWVGNMTHEFQSRKKAVISAYIQRQLNALQSGHADAASFYDYACIGGGDQPKQLYTIFLQEALAYRLYGRLEALKISPVCIASPALLWQAKLHRITQAFDDSGIGFIHRVDSECFLYFFFMGQFLFSRNIELSETMTGDDDEICNRLNYEINQSFYLFSQKTKSSVDRLFMLTPDPGERTRLAELMGREINVLPEPLSPPAMSGYQGIPASCRAFGVDDLKATDLLAIAYKPLEKELTWRPVQWAGIAVGLVLGLFLTVENVYLHSWSAAVKRQTITLKAADTQPPELVLQNISMALDEINQALKRPSGGGTVLRALLDMPDSVSVDKLSFDLAPAPHLAIEAIVRADHPESFKAILRAFLDRLNLRFELKARPLQEKDVRITLERRQDDEKRPVYRINFGFELAS